MIDLAPVCRVAVVQAEPVLFDAEASTRKAVELIGKAAEQRAKLIVLPELFVPGYPYGLNFGFTVGARTEAGRADWARYAKESVVIGDEHVAALQDAARAADAYVSIGISERDAVTGTLYNSNIIIDPSGEVRSAHRKLKPTGSERVVWGDADRGFFPTVDTPWGPIGALICWESYMPLARVALYQKGVTIYIAPNTNDNPEWQATVEHIAIEGRCFVINCDQYATRAAYPADLASSDELARITSDVVCRGGSSVVDPKGHTLSDPVWDREEILIEDLDIASVAANRMEFDPVGHYSRPDVLSLSVRDE